MNRDTLVFSVCSFALGLIIGSLLIGPHLRSAAAPAAAPASAPASPTAAVSTDAGNSMAGVREQIAALQKRVDQNPKDFDALAQLGEMYMEGTKFPQAIGYLERALAVREDSRLRSDLGFCYRQNDEPEKALAAFHQASRDAPDQWQPLYNEAFMLAEMRRAEEARALVPKLQALGADSAAVQRLRQQLGQ